MSYNGNYMIDGDTGSHYASPNYADNQNYCEFCLKPISEFQEETYCKLCTDLYEDYQYHKNLKKQPLKQYDRNKNQANTL